MFVQFPHPGDEHRPMGAVMEWNRSGHARKFLKATGDYVRDGQLSTGVVAFWGEWEPQSEVIGTFEGGGRGYPRWQHEPYWELPRHRLHLQNTDPLVFGDEFLYSNCRQAKNRKLRELAPGSLIVFGSKYQREFVVDTVFVAGQQGEDFTPATSGDIRCDEWVREVVLDRLRSSPTVAGPGFRLYRGLMRDQAPAGPFSFVPCRPHVDGDPAFPRPVLRLPGKWIEPNLAMGAKATPAGATEIRELWEEIVGQVSQAGLALGVRLDAPPHRIGTEEEMSRVRP